MSLLIISYKASEPLLNPLNLLSLCSVCDEVGDGCKLVYTGCEGQSKVFLLYFLLCVHPADVNIEDSFTTDGSQVKLLCSKAQSSSL